MAMLYESLPMPAIPSKYEIKNPVFLAFLGLGIFLTVVNVLLVRENRTLKGVLRELQRHMAPQEGSAISSLYGRDIEKKPLVILQGIDSRETVLLVFSPQCANCDETWPTWRTAIQSMDTKRFRIVGVNLSPELPRDYLAQRHVTDIPVIAELDPQLITSYNFQLTPLTVLLDSKGRVDKVWTGILAGQEKKEFEETVRISAR